jgi:hypothetical protein
MLKFIIDIFRKLTRRVSSDDRETAAEDPFDRILEEESRQDPLAFREGRKGIGDDFFFLLMAAKHGNAEAQSLAGEAYSVGNGCPRSDLLAEKWFRQAANAGFANAQFGLAHVLLKGYGVERNLAEAAQWLRKAAAQGQENAGRVLEQLDYAAQHQDDVDALYQWFDEIGYPRRWLSEDEIATTYWFDPREYRGKIRDIPKAIRCLKSLEKLCLADAPIKSLPENIGELQNLRLIELGNRAWRELENGVHGVRTNTEFTRLPASFTRLKNLERLDIQRTALRELPEDFGELANLEYLELSCNALERLPGSMARLKKLTRLFIGGNQLTGLPEWIGEFEKLEHLCIGGNPLKTVPDWLGEMPNLRSLVCSPDMQAPMLARVRRKLTLPLGKLQATFLERLGDLGFELPENKVAARERGSLGPGAESGEGGHGYGDTCDFLFGRGEKGEYVDYYIAHRVWGDRHARIWETGETERLETFSVMFSSPEEVGEIGDRLRAKGFSPTY